MGTVGVPRDGNYNPVPAAVITPGSGFAVPQSGSQQVDPVTGLYVAPQIYALVDGQKATYRAAITALAAVTGCTDLFTLTGSASKVIRLSRVEFSGTIATAAMYLDVLGILRSTADSAGTKTNPSAIPLDTNDPAATAIVAAYTANPTLGNAIGTIRADKYLLALTGTPAQPDRLVWEFGNRPGERAVVLRGANSVFALNLNGVAISNATLIDIAIEWTEE